MAVGVVLLCLRVCPFNATQRPKCAVHRTFAWMTRKIVHASCIHNRNEVLFSNSMVLVCSLEVDSTDAMVPTVLGLVGGQAVTLFRTLMFCFHQEGQPWQ